MPFYVLMCILPRYYTIGIWLFQDCLQEILHEFISYSHKKNHKLLYEACGLFLSRYSLFLRNTMRILKLSSVQILLSKVIKR